MVKIEEIRAWFKTNELKNVIKERYPDSNHPSKIQKQVSLINDLLVFSDRFLTDYSFSKFKGSVELINNKILKLRRIGYDLDTYGDSWVEYEVATKQLPKLEYELSTTDYAEPPPIGREKWKEFLKREIRKCECTISSEERGAERFMSAGKDWESCEHEIFVASIDLCDRFLRELELKRERADSSD
jgi:hypothetical protein